MNSGRIVIVTGPPGTGKTTAAALLAERSPYARSVHLHTDDFYHALAKGAVPPHQPESHGQNRVVIEAFLAAAERFARGGYDVWVDGIVGPWFLEPFLEAARAGIPVHYVILRADKAETLRRAMGREKLTPAENAALVEAMWSQFSGLGPYEANVLDTTGQSVPETAAALEALLASGQCRLPGPQSL